MADATIEDLLGGASKGFQEMLRGFAEAATQRTKADGQIGVPPVLGAMGGALVDLAEGVFEGLSDVLGGLDPEGAAEAAAAWASSKIQRMIDAVNGLLGEMLAGAGAAAAGALGAVLGLMEAIKKSVHLLLDRFVDPKAAGRVTAPLDLINNLLGNMAEVVSPETGAKARRFRADMYGQLHDVRRADSARWPRATRIEVPREAD
jgi:hypothetical protein